MTIDLDAIQARADAATEGSWSVEVDVDPRTGGGADFIHSYAAGSVIAYSNDRSADDEFIAHARDDIPSLLSLVRELQAGIPARVVLDGDPEVIEAALDALPLKSVVTSDDDAGFIAWAKTGTAKGQPWRNTLNGHAHDSAFLSKYCAPLAVLR